VNRLRAADIRDRRARRTGVMRAEEMDFPGVHRGRKCHENCRRRDNRLNSHRRYNALTQLSFGNEQSERVASQSSGKRPVTG